MRRRRAYKDDPNSISSQQNQSQNGRGEWAATVFENKLLEEFYRNNIIPEHEWEQFLSTLKEKLNTSVRICPTSFGTDDENHKEDSKQKQQHFVCALLAQLQHAFPADKVRLLDFIPLAIDFALPRSALKKKNTAATASDGAAAAPLSDNRLAKAALNALSDHGFLSRQEVVSMVPPVLLDVRPGHRVLDMCAAPGSKTVQMLEKLVCVGPSVDAGFVVANDVNAGRLDVLQKQAGRNPFASAHLVVTNFDARLFPTPLKVNPEYEASDVTDAGDTARPLPFIPVRFDRVLCDAMCSGDGTLRKSADLWERWKPNNSLALHASQKGVLFRGMQLLRKDGIIVYSTCSMHPVEDEAVVAAAIRMAAEAGGKFELIDPRERLPNLQFYPGRRSWKIMAPDGSWVAEDDFVKKSRSKAEASAAVADDDDDDKSNARKTGASQSSSPPLPPYPSVLIPSMFPSYAASSAETVPNIEYCCRVVPHHQDTGGFFIAAMRCTREVPASAAHQKHLTNQRSSRQQQQQQQQQLQQQAGQEKQDPAQQQQLSEAPNRRNQVKDADCFCPISEEIKQEVQSYLHLPADFPYERLYCRKLLSREPKIYFVSEDAKVIIDQISQSGSGKNGSRIVSVGVRVIESISRFSFKASRFSAEGASVMAQYVPPSFIYEIDAENVLKEVDDQDRNQVDNNNKKSPPPATSPTAFLSSIRLKVPAGWRTNASDVVKKQQQQQQQQQRESAIVTSSSSSSPLPNLLKHILVSIRLGPNVPNRADENTRTERGVVVPAELDSSNYFILRLQRTTLNLLRYSVGGFGATKLADEGDDGTRKSRKNGDDNDDGDDGDSDGEDQKQDDENCCQGPRAPEQPQ